MTLITNIATILGIPGFICTVVGILYQKQITDWLDRRRTMRSAKAAEKELRADKEFHARVVKAAADPTYCLLMMEHFRRKDSQRGTAMSILTVVFTILMPFVFVFVIFFGGSPLGVGYNAELFATYRLLFFFPLGLFTMLFIFVNSSSRPDAAGTFASAVTSIIAPDLPLRVVTPPAGKIPSKDQE